MKLSQNTLTVLKNFSVINNSIVLKPGKVQKTISPQKTIMAQAELEEDFPVEFAIFDLSNFINNATMEQNSELEFSDEAVEIKTSKFNFFYYASAANLILSPGDKELEIAKPDAEFDLSKDNLETLLKLSAMNNLPNISIISSSGELSVRVHNKVEEKTNKRSAYGKYVLAQQADYKDFEVVFRTENLKMIPMDYHVRINFQGFAIFENKTAKLKYIVTIQK
jgi:gp45 sliding clamp, C terminal